MTSSLYKFGGLVAAATLCIAFGAVAETVWHPDAGWVDMAAAPGDAPEPLFRHALGLLTRGDVRNALDLLLRVGEREMDQQLRDKVIYYQAECRLRLGQHQKAFALCESLLRPDATPALRDKVMGLGLEVGRSWAADDPKRAADALRALLDRKPEGELGHRTRVELADVEMRLGEHDRARELYQQVFDAGIKGKAGERAGFGAGWADLIACRDREYRAERLERAMKQFQAHLERFPRADNTETARECVWACGSLLREQSVDRRPVFWAVVRMLAEESDEAYAILKKAANKYVGTYMGEAAKYYMAVYWYHRKEYWKAFKAFEELMEEYPGASRTRQVVDYEFEIAKQLMTHQGFWRDWMLWRACDALEKVVEHNPSGPKAPDAQMLLGDCYMERWYWEDAYEAYNVVVESYPNSKWLSTAQFKCGLAKFREAEFTEDKRELLIQAQRAFTVYLRDSPSGAFADQARQLLSRCRYREAALKWQAAKLYERVERPRAAVATLADIARNYRETVWAGRAKERLAAYAKLGYEP